MTISYLFRTPRFPIIFTIGSRLFCAQSDPEFQSRMAKENFKSNTLYRGVDITGAVWNLNVKNMYISPSYFPKRWSKKEVITAYNRSDNCKILNIPYSEKSLTSKKYEKVFSDILDLVEQSLKNGEYNTI